MPTYGKDATNPAWSMPRTICLPAIATSSSIRCVRGWSKARSNIRGPVMPSTRFATLTPCSPRTRATSHWAPISKAVHGPIKPSCAKPCPTRPCRRSGSTFSSSAPWGGMASAAWSKPRPGGSPAPVPRIGRPRIPRYLVSEPDPVSTRFRSAKFLRVVRPSAPRSIGIPTPRATAATTRARPWSLAVEPPGPPGRVRR